MNKIFIVTGIAAATAAGCATPPARLQAPVGPNPFVAKAPDPQGNLEVFSACMQQNPEGQSPGLEATMPGFSYYVRTGYSIYDSNGKLVRSVGSNSGSDLPPAPRIIALPPGTYRVEALASVRSGEWTMVPVVVEAGSTTKVHFDGHWAPPAHTPGSELVYSPAGYPLGWRANIAPGS